MTHFLRPRPLVALLCLALTGCIDSDEYDVKGVTANPSITLPLAYGDLGIEDFLSSRDSSYIRIGADGVVNLYYEQTLEAPDIRNLIQIPDRTFPTKTINIPTGTIPASSAEVSYPLTSTLDFQFTPENLNRILLKQGMVTVKASMLSTPANFNYEVLVELPDFKKNGVAFAQRVSGTSVLDLTGYDAQFNNDVTDLKLTVIVKPHAAPVTVLPGTQVRVDLSFAGMDFEFVTGFFGTNRTVNMDPQTIKVDPFTPTTNNGTISLFKPQLSFIVVNEYGLPVDVTFDQIEARKAGSAPLSVTMSKLFPIKINPALTPGDTAQTLVSITNSKALMDYSPEEFYYRITSVANRGIGSGNNFCADTATLNVRFIAQVPLWGKASGIVIADTTDIDIGDLENSDVESLFIKANIINKLPLDARFQIYLANENSVIIDSLFTNAQAEDIIAPSTVDANGELVSPGIYNDEIPVAKEKVNRIFDARKLILKARMHTVRNADGTQPNVKFKANYTMNVKLGLRADLKVDVDL